MTYTAPQKMIISTAKSLPIYALKEALASKNEVAVTHLGPDERFHPREVVGACTVIVVYD